MSASHRIAIIGAGPSGLAAARAFHHDSGFTVHVYEQRSDVGGVWRFDGSTSGHDLTPVPSTNPNAPQEAALSRISAVYDQLETNIPAALMSYPDHPFPPHLPAHPAHSAILSYIHTYAGDLRHLITFNTRVTRAYKPLGSSRWHLETTPASRSPSPYDFLIVANGHYNLPYVPSLPGLSAFPRSAITHSKSFRRATDFRERRVLVVGNSASGYDIAAQLAQVVRAPLLQSLRSPSALSDGAIVARAELVALVPETRGAIFADGTREDGLDHVVFCTGYLFSMPFLEVRGEPVVTDGVRVRGVWKHLFYTHDPSLSFVGLPLRVVPFPLAHNQAVVIRGVYSGRVKLPEAEEMRAWEEKEVERKGERGFQVLGWPEDADYLEELADMGGEGTMRWDEKMKAWRADVKGIKKKDVELRKRGIVARTVEEILAG